MSAPTELLYQDDSYLSETTARVTALGAEGGVEFDRTIFYANSGGQPGDSGVIVCADGREIPVATAVHPDGDKARVLHILAPEASPPAIGEEVTLKIDWERRHKLMRMHTAMHLATVVFPYPVTGGQVSTEKGRLDFDMAEPPEDIPALEKQLNAFIAEAHAVKAEWVSEAELDANPGLVKSLNVAPPRGQGRVRLIRIGPDSDPVDVQPCGGTHIRSTAEIGPLRIGKIEKKGRQNRRINLHFVE